MLSHSFYTVELVHFLTRLNVQLETSFPRWPKDQMLIIILCNFRCHWIRAKLLRSWKSLIQSRTKYPAEISNFQDRNPFKFVDLRTRKGVSALEGTPYCNIKQVSHERMKKLEAGERALTVSRVLRQSTTSSCPSSPSLPRCVLCDPTSQWVSSSSCQKKLRSWINFSQASAHVD